MYRLPPTSWDFQPLLEYMERGEKVRCDHPAMECQPVAPQHSEASSATCSLGPRQPPKPPARYLRKSCISPHSFATPALLQVPAHNNHPRYIPPSGKSPALAPANPISPASPRISLHCFHSLRSSSHLSL